MLAKLAGYPAIMAWMGYRPSC